MDHRRQLDAELCAEVSRLDGWGNNRIEAEAKKVAARLDVAAVVERSAKAAAHRCVTIRPAPDTMTDVSVLLPVQQGVAVYAALKRQADITFDGRSRGQVMAETTLVGDDEEPGWLDGYGPIPAALACRLTGDAVADAEVKATLRRLYRHPTSGQLVAMESRARVFPKGLAAFIGLRDQTCRTPYCNAPIRHCDHAVPDRDGGPITALNGLGECEACNYTKEAPGWTVTTAESDGEHRAEFTTPTGATYRSTAPPLPGPPIRRRLSLIEGRLSIDIVTFAAA